MARINLSAIPGSAQTDLCIMAILQTAEAMNTPEGREAIERGREEYRRHQAEKSAGASGA